MDNDPAAVKAFFDEALAMRAEGIMVKLLDDVADAGEGDAEGEGTASGEGDELGSGSDSDSSRAPSPKPATISAAPPAAAATKSRRRALPATYEPDKRADSWCKVKKDLLEGEGAIGDSLDLVPIGAWYGQGRKNAWWSPFLLACYDEETGAYTAVTKCLSGFTECVWGCRRGIGAGRGLCSPTRASLVEFLVR